MSPVHDPRFSGTRWQTMLDEHRRDTERAARMDYVKPLVMLVLGAGTVMGIIAATESPGAAVLYPIALGVELVFGVIGLWLACKLFLDGAGPLGLAILRLAGIYAATDVVAVVVGPLGLLGWLIHLGCYVGLLMWLFELDVGESALLAVVTFVLKVVAAVAVMTLMMGGA